MPSRIMSLTGNPIKKHGLILGLGNTECSQEPSDICTRKFDIYDHNHL